MFDKKYLKLEKMFLDLSAELHKIVSLKVNALETKLSQIKTGIDSNIDNIRKFLIEEKDINIKKFDSLKEEFNQRIEEKIENISDNFKINKSSIMQNIDTMQKSLDYLKQGDENIKKDYEEKIKNTEKNISDISKIISAISQKIEILADGNKNLSDLFNKEKIAIIKKLDELNNNEKELYKNAEITRNELKELYRLSKNSSNEINILNASIQRLSKNLDEANSNQKVNITRIDYLEKDISSIKMAFSKLTENMQNIKIPDINSLRAEFYVKLNAVITEFKGDIYNSTERSLNLFNQDMNKRYYDTLSKIIN